MNRVLGREVALIAVTGLLGAVWVPFLMGMGPAPRLFWIGLVMGLNFAAIYALSNMVGARMSPMWKGYLGVISWIVAFGDDVLFLATLARAGAGVSLSMGWETVYVASAPAVVGLLLMGVAAGRAGAGKRLAAAWDAVYAYSFPMVGVKWLLVGLFAGGQPVGELPPGAIPTGLMAIQLGVLYTGMRVLVRIFAPSPGDVAVAERPRVRRSIPDAVVGLVEGTTRRRARPYATREDGSLDEDAISLLCRPMDAEHVMRQVESALEGRPFDVSTGVKVDRHVEIVIRPRA